MPRVELLSTGNGAAAEARKNRAIDCKRKTSLYGMPEANRNANRLFPPNFAGNHWISAVFVRRPLNLA